jgi:type IV secretory pathway VirB2 component (pilin)
MEKRIMGISLTIMGVIGLIVAGIQFMNGPGGRQGSKQVIMYGVLGIIFFFSGIALLKNTSNRPT